MNTREENVAEATREAQQAAEREQIRRQDLKWAQRWYQGDPRCPGCGGRELGIPDVQYEDQSRFEIRSCLSCSARWEVELRQTAWVVLRQDNGDDDWIELEMFEEPRRVRLSERERARVVAALRFWRREGALSAADKRDLETGFDRLPPLSAEESDALYERIKRLYTDRSDAVQA